MFYTELDDLTQSRRIWVTTGRTKKHEDSRQAFGRMIKAERKHLNWTQADVAEKADCSESYIGFLERGYKLPSIEVFTRILNALGANPTLNSNGNVLTFELVSQDATVILTVEEDSPPTHIKVPSERENTMALMLGRIIQVLTDEPYKIRDVYRDLGLDPNYNDYLDAVDEYVSQLEDEIRGH